jgi:hypothetical protein
MAARRIRESSKVDPRDITIIQIAMRHPDESVQIVATAIGAETPFVH